MSVTGSWEWDLATIARNPASSACLAASAWVIRRGIGDGPEWQCRSTAPTRRLSTALIRAPPDTDDDVREEPLEQGDVPRPREAPPPGATPDCAPVPGGPPAPVPRG